MHFLHLHSMVCSLKFSVLKRFFYYRNYVINESKYIVFESNWKQLFRHCVSCHAVTEPDMKTIGTSLSVWQRCSECGHVKYVINLNIVFWPSDTIAPNIYSWEKIGHTIKA